MDEYVILRNHQGNEVQVPIDKYNVSKYVKMGYKFLAKAVVKPMNELSSQDNEGNQYVETFYNQTKGPDLTNYREHEWTVANQQPYFEFGNESDYLPQILLTVPHEVGEDEATVCVELVNRLADVINGSSAGYMETRNQTKS